VLAAARLSLLPPALRLGEELADDHEALVGEVGRRARGGDELVEREARPVESGRVEGDGLGIAAARPNGSEALYSVEVVGQEVDHAGCLRCLARANALRLHWPGEPCQTDREPGSKRGVGDRVVVESSRSANIIVRISIVKRRHQTVAVLDSF
jgi:hypothetical protein